MTLVLVGAAAVVFAALAVAGHALWHRRQLRQTRLRWEERERRLNRKP